MATEKSKNGGSTTTALAPRPSAPAQRSRGFFSDLWPDDWTDLFSMRMWPGLTQAQQQRPELNVYRKDNNLIVEAAIPGMKKEDIHLHVEDGHLMMSGSFRHEEKEEKDHYYRSEIRRGSFQRSIPLPRGVDATEARASYEDGMLKVTLPMKAEDPEAGRINID